MEYLGPRMVNKLVWSAGRASLRSRKHAILELRFARTLQEQPFHFCQYMLSSSKATPGSEPIPSKSTNASVGVDSFLYTLPEQQELMGYGSNRLRLEVFGKKAVGGVSQFMDLVHSAGGFVNTGQHFSNLATSCLVELEEARLVEVAAAIEASSDFSLCKDSKFRLHERLQQKLQPSASSKKSRPFALLIQITWSEGDGGHRNQVGDLRKDAKPLGPERLGGGLVLGKLERRSLAKQQVGKK